MLIASLFLFAVYRFFVAKRMCQLKIPFNISSFLYGAANFTFFDFIYGYFFAGTNNLVRAIFPIFYFLLTYISLYFLGFFKRKDLKDLKSLVNVKSMKDYVAIELFDEELNYKSY